VLYFCLRRVEAVAQFCKRTNLGHIINNAYGVQASKITHQINEAMRLGRFVLNGSVALLSFDSSAVPESILSCRVLIKTFWCQLAVR